MLSTKMQMSIWCTCLLTNMQMQLFTMQISFAGMQMQLLFFSMQNAPLRRCKCDSSMMQISHAGMWMQSLFMMMKMSPCGDADVNLLWVCHDANALLWVRLDVNASLWVCHDVNAFYLMQMQFNQKFLLFSKSRLPRSLKPKCFQNSIYFFKNYSFLFRRGLNASASFLPQKHVLFWLKAPPKIGDHY